MVGGQKEKMSLKGTVMKCMNTVPFGSCDQCMSSCPSSRSIWSASENCPDHEVVSTEYLPKNNESGSKQARQRETKQEERLDQKSQKERKHQIMLQEMHAHR